ncbi:unnamed protein product, partial [Brassica oleracea var. botrytis]
MFIFIASKKLSLSLWICTLYKIACYSFGPNLHSIVFITLFWYNVFFFIK